MAGPSHARHAPASSPLLERLKTRHAGATKAREEDHAFRSVPADRPPRPHTPDRGGRPAHVLPIGVNGSTPDVAQRIGFPEGLNRARALLAEAGLPDGFSFDPSCGHAAVAGVSDHLLAQKSGADRARGRIDARLNPMEQVTMRTESVGGRSTAVITFRNPPAVENELWVAATVERVARRVGWTPPREHVELVPRAAAEPDTARARERSIECRRRIVDQAHVIMLFQPTYHVAVRSSDAAIPLTAAGWMAELGGARPA